MNRDTDMDDHTTYSGSTSYSTDDDDDDSDSDADLGIVDATTQENTESNARAGNGESSRQHGKGGAGAKGKDEDMSREPTSANQRKQITKQDKKDLHRKQRGLMQWKPMRNLAFARDEAVFAARKVVGKGKLEGREPTVESEY